MTHQDVLARISQIYAEKGWPLSETISIYQETVRFGWFFLKSRKVWIAKTDTNLRGGNQVFEFDDATGEILRQFVLPK